MHLQTKRLVLCLAAFAMSAAAQNPVVNSSGSAGYIPVLATTPTTGNTTVGNSPIVVSGSNVGIGMGTATPGSLLSLGNTQVNPKLLVLDQGTAIEGFGILPHEFRMFDISGSGNFMSFGQVSSTDGVTWSESMRLQGGMLGINTGASTSGALSIELGGGAKGVPSATAGTGFQLLGTAGWLDGNTAASGTAAGFSFATIGEQTISAVNTGVTTTNAYTLNILGPVTAGTNETFTNSTALNIAPGSLSNTAIGYGLQVAAPTGASTNYAAAFTGGNVGIGTTTPLYNLDVTGTVRATGVINAATSGVKYPDGNTQVTAWTGVLCGGDYAEAVNAKGSRKVYEPGDVLVIGDSADGEVEKSAEPYSTMVAGIYATKPGVIGRRQSMLKESEEIPMAMIGIVPTKVTTENGHIHRGDLLVTSSTTGYAMKGTDRSRLIGAVIGKAMGPLESGTGVIEVLVTLQ